MDRADLPLDGEPLTVKMCLAPNERAARPSPGHLCTIESERVHGETMPSTVTLNEINPVVRPMPGPENTLLSSSLTRVRDSCASKSAKSWPPESRCPQTPVHVKGVINLRGKVVPVVDLRLKFALPAAELHAAHCIIVTQVQGKARR